MQLIGGFRMEMQSSTGLRVLAWLGDVPVMMLISAFGRNAVGQNELWVHLSSPCAFKDLGPFDISFICRWRRHSVPSYFLGG